MKDIRREVQQGGRPGRVGRPAGSVGHVKRLALATTLSTFALIVLGGVVRVSDSGLGCGPAGSGFNGWPFCNGDVAPGRRPELDHRVRAPRRGDRRRLHDPRPVRDGGPPEAPDAGHRRRAACWWPPRARSAARPSRGTSRRATWRPTSGWRWSCSRCLIYIVRATREAAARAGRARAALALAASAAVFATIVAGGYMAGTQNYGRADYQLGDGAHHACGKEFPTCNGELLPFGEARLVDIHLTHRAFMYLASVARARPRGGGAAPPSRPCATPGRRRACSASRSWSAR